jgi:glucose-6-phosphate isomerase
MCPCPTGRCPRSLTLAKSQAEGDLRVLSERGRRVVHLHLPDNCGATLRQVGDLVQKIARTL